VVPAGIMNSGLSVIQEESRRGSQYSIVSTRVSPTSSWTSKSLMG
jgi:hypothetical protein